nr:unnamed protein product [Callosobruchus chinensis]
MSSQKTEVTCYWAESKLSKVGTSEDLSSYDESNRLFEEVIEMGIENKSESQLLRHFKSHDIATNLGIYQLMPTFSSPGQSSYDDFIEFCFSVLVSQTAAYCLI